MQPIPEHRRPPPDDAAVRAKLSEMLFGFMRTQALSVAAKLGLADIIGDEPCDIGDVARQAGAHESSLYRLVRFLASEGVFEEVERESSLPTAFPTVPAPRRPPRCATSRSQWEASNPVD